MPTVDDILSRVRNEHRTVLTEFEAKELLTVLEIPIPPQKLIPVSAGKAAILKAGQEIGYPVVMKLMSDKIVHKTDAGAVKLGLDTPEAAEKAYQELVKIECDDPHKAISVQKMASKPITEIIIGSLQDPQFGATVMFGIGGVLVEIMKDVAFRIAPITDYDADEMIQIARWVPGKSESRFGCHQRHIEKSCSIRI
jgi:acyl-CoA synthetase (NDP forming)